MIYERIYLKEHFAALAEFDSPAYLDVYAPSQSPELGDDRRYPSVLVCPGGGYGMTSDREAEPIAFALLGRGLGAFVLRYSVAPARYPKALLEVGAAMAYIRQNAEKYGVQEDAISVMGFSAGGHLAGNYGTHWDREVLDPLHVEKEFLRPNGLILCYGVLSFGEMTHLGSVKNLLGPDATEEQRRALSFEHAVSESTPPTFLWHTCTDKAVPVENSLYAAEALAKFQIPFELHVYPEGGHGLSVASWVTTRDENYLPPKYLTKWIDDCANWVLRNAGRR